MRYFCVYNIARFKAHETLAHTFLLRESAREQGYCRTAPFLKACYFEAYGLAHTGYDGDIFNLFVLLSEHGFLFRDDADKRAEIYFQRHLGCANACHSLEYFACFSCFFKCRKRKIALFCAEIHSFGLVLICVHIVPPLFAFAFFVLVNLIRRGTGL